MASDKCYLADKIMALPSLHNKLHTVQPLRAPVDIPRNETRRPHLSRGSPLTARPTSYRSQAGPRTHGFCRSGSRLMPVAIGRSLSTPRRFAFFLTRGEPQPPKLSPPPYPTHIFHGPDCTRGCPKEGGDDICAYEGRSDRRLEKTTQLIPS